MIKNDANTNAKAEMKEISLFFDDNFTILYLPSLLTDFIIPAMFLRVAVIRESAIDIDLLRVMGNVGIANIPSIPTLYSSSTGSAEPHTQITGSP